MEEFFDDAREIQCGPMFAYADDRCHAVSSNAVFVIRIARTLPDTFRRATCFLRSTLSDEIAVIRVSADSCSLKTLQRFMLGMYATKPTVSGASCSAPRAAEAFISNLVEASNSRRTTLYAPEETRDAESVVMNWARQIRRALSCSADIDACSFTDQVETGPLVRVFNFWRDHASNLRGIQEQLRSPSVRALVRIIADQKGVQHAYDDFKESETLIDREIYLVDCFNDVLSLIEPKCDALAAKDARLLTHGVEFMRSIIDIVSSAWRGVDERDRELITGHFIDVLKRIADQILMCCRNEFSSQNVVETIVAGVARDDVVRVLSNCSRVSGWWKDVYSEKQAAADDGNNLPCVDLKTAFSQLDAFSHRCSDLLELCEAREQFVSAKDDAPSFSSPCVQELKRQLSAVESLFSDAVIGHLKKIEYDVLDVSTLRWHDDFAALKSRIKNLENKTCKSIAESLERATCLDERVELIQFTWVHVARRDSVKRAVKTSASRTYALFAAELQALKQQFDSSRQKPTIYRDLPRMYGAVHWANDLLQELRDVFRKLTMANDGDSLPPIPELTDLLSVYDITVPQVELYMKEKYKEWFYSVQTVNVMDLMGAQSSLGRDADGSFRVTYSPDVSAARENAIGFASLGLEIPENIRDVSFGPLRDLHATQRVRLNLLVGRYNELEHRIREERNLGTVFEATMRKLQLFFDAAAETLTWASDPTDVDDFSVQAEQKLSSFEERLRTFGDFSTRIAEALGELERVTVKDREIDRVGTLVEFQDSNDREVMALQSKVEAISTVISEALREQRNASGEIESQSWLAYMTEVENSIVQSVRTVVLRNLYKMHAMFGRPEVGGTPRKPLVLMNTDLATQDGRLVVKTDPFTSQVRDSIQTYFDKTLDVVSIFASSRDTGGSAIDGKNGEMISCVRKSIEESFEEFVKSLDEWTGRFRTRYGHIWREESVSVDDSAYIEQRIRQLQDSIEDVKSEEHSHTFGFVRVEYGRLKQTLVSRAESCVQKMLCQLRAKVELEIDGVKRAFSTNVAPFGLAPSNLEELVSQVSDLQRLKANVDLVPDTFARPRESFRILSKFVDVTDREHELLSSIDHNFDEYKKELDAVEARLETEKDVFKSQLRTSVMDYERDAMEYRSQFDKTAPVHTHPACTKVACGDAQRFIDSAENSLAQFDSRLASIKSGLLVFTEIHTPSSCEVERLKEGLEEVKSLWRIVCEFNDMYERWKDGKFDNLNVELMESSAIAVNKKIIKIGRGSAKEWGAWISLKGTVDSFKRLMPLIIDMRNPAVRQRHWNLVMEECGERFDPYSENFTLDRVVQLGLDQHAQFISETSTDATKELAVENTLADIANAWTTINLDTGRFREGRDDVYKLKSADEIFTQLEDNTVTLSALKASKFYLVFERTIVSWEKTLGLVNDTIELVLKVQLAWMYLENIFIGSEDIAHQLPNETQTFTDINWRFIEIMRKLHEDCNVITACTTMNAPDISEEPDRSLFSELKEMDEKLERIQKSLENYLESKRQLFPRFYFLSNDDVLQILGQSKDPKNVQQHFKSMFEGIKKLDMFAPDPLTGRRRYESVSMMSPDGETLQFDSPVCTEGRPEEWLNDVEAAMYAATKTHLAKTVDQCRAKGTKKDKWVLNNPGQMLITAGCISWTMECERALRDKENVKEALKRLRRKWVQYLNKLVEMTRMTLDSITRKKLTALITIEVHARDVIEKLIKSRCSSPHDFDWVAQLRFYWDRESKHCTAKQVLSVFDYGYEYQGNNGRLVVTPLTDRCYMTLGAAMFTRRGGNPLGPAGTGKTETVKDFGKALARYVIVFNCSDGVDYKMTGKMFSGLAQTGAWACLDEFNRITVEVLSVVATQISVVMAAVKQKLKMFDFEGQHIRLIPSCGVFVTMNPGYAGRAELPDNLKAIVRPVSMMVPDFCLIAEIMMFSEGFKNAKCLAKKMVAIMELSQQQLSKQDHYDYTLRSFIIPISRAAGVKKRTMPDTDEQLILFDSMRELIIPKLVYADIPIFKALLTDLFPEINAPERVSAVLKEALIKECELNNVQPVDAWISKIIQIFDCKTARHGNMIVGKTGSGKTCAREMLMKAMSRLKQSEAHGEHFQHVEVYPINPLALSNDELYGSFDPATHEWSDGILAKIMRTVCKDESSAQKWILMDGPVDTLWIESMNTLLDDNKLLTLLSGERIMMSPQVSILFEVEDLSQASPATVSRTGMIYFNVEDLGWKPFVKSWQNKRVSGERVDEEVESMLSKCVEKYIDVALTLKRARCKELVQTDQLASVRQLTKLFDAHGVDDSRDVEAVFIFCLIWSIGGSIDHASRILFDGMLHQVMPSKMFPHTPASSQGDTTVFDFFYNCEIHKFVLWEEKIPKYNVPGSDVPFFKIMVPTIDSVRTKHLMKMLLGVGMNALVVGNVGVGKSMIIDSCLSELPEEYTTSKVSFSAQTSSASLQETVEVRLEKRSKGNLAPPGGKKLVLAIDDLNMPKKSEFGFIPPLELLKLWHDNGFWYDRSKQERTHINDMKLLAAMAPPGGGRNQFSQRILSIFAVLNITDPSDTQLEHIYGTIVSQKLANFDQSIASMGSSIAKASIVVYNSLCQELLPTPSKSHYLFNTRDLAKVIQGVCRATRHFYDAKDSIIQLWAHENLRVFGDRLWDDVDFDWLARQLDTSMRVHFGTSWKDVFADGEHEPVKDDTARFDSVPFVSFLRQGLEFPPYEAVSDEHALRECLTEKLEDYGLESGNAPMDLVLFDDAVLHVCRIHRILTQPRGHAMLVGVGGSGRKSLARLAAYVAEMKTFSIEITKNYNHTEFREDLKALYRQTGVAGKPTVFVLDDSQIVDEVFLEDVNNALTSGDIPGLFSRDETSGVCEEVRKIARAENYSAVTHAELFAFFMQRVMKNLHIVLCFSPIGDVYRERLRMFPGLINCCTLDWFKEWPVEALLEVAARKLRDDDLDAKNRLCEVFGKIHASTSSTAEQMFAAIKRKMYVTPTNYIEFVNLFRSLLEEKRNECTAKIQKLQGGLHKLDETETQVREMQAVCIDKANVVAAAKQDCEGLLKIIIKDKRAADEQSILVSAEAERIEIEAQNANAIAGECQLKLDEALPALREAEEALNVLTKKDMGELKSYVKPPALVELCLKGVLTVLKRPTTWEEAKKQLGDSGFLDRLLRFDKDALVDNLLAKIAKFVNNPDYQPEVIGKVSNAAKGLCKWVHAMYSYGNVAREIAPKRLTLKRAQDELRMKQEALAVTQADLADVMQKVANLKEKYEESASNKASLEDELAELKLKLERAEALVDGLSGEKQRWADTIQDIQSQMSRLPGDVCIAAAFMSYAGAFPSEYRDVLVEENWKLILNDTGIVFSPDFSFADFLANSSDVRDWNIQGLPADSFSTENGVICTRGHRWPLLIDPQGQGNKWIKALEAPNKLIVTTLNAPNMVRQVEHAVQFGLPILIQDVKEIIDPILENVVAKSFTKKGGSITVKLGDKDLEYSPNFRLYFTTKMSNPCYTPEVSTKLSVINFTVKEQGLNAQLRDLVVRREKPELAAQKQDLIVKVARGKKKLAELEDLILDLLSKASGSLLDNVELIDSLTRSKSTSEEVEASLKIADSTAAEIERASSAYAPVAIRATILYFTLYNLADIDPMYQFSLDAYVSLFNASIVKSRRKNRSTTDDVEQRLSALNDYHTYAVYRYTSRALFESHKLLLSLQMCVRIQATDGSIPLSEWEYLVHGGSIANVARNDVGDTCAWLSETPWSNVVALEENFKETFSGLKLSMKESHAKDWQSWYRHAKPEACPLPGEWNSRLSALQQLIILRAVRLDRVENGIRKYVSQVLGKKFIDPPVLNLHDVFLDSTSEAPCIFVLSSGVDPTSNLKQLAETLQMSDKLYTVALGQGQASIATEFIRRAHQQGGWVFLANCHLMISWLPELQKIVEEFEIEKPHPDFRLWLSSNPTPEFPLALLQRSLKMTTEPPKGLRANLARLYATCVSEDSFRQCTRREEYGKLLFALAFFHAVVLERRKFGMLGFNIAYDFNDTDFAVSDDLLKSYLDGYEDVPWQALRYLIGQANYGGRITDELDRRVVEAYLSEFFCERVITEKECGLSPLAATYHVPAKTDELKAHRDFIDALPLVDHAEAFGQHSNADISYMITASDAILSACAKMRISADGGKRTGKPGGNDDDRVEARVLRAVEEILRAIPSELNVDAIRDAKSSNLSPLNINLIQETQRYNQLLRSVHEWLRQLDRGIRGLVVMSRDLDELYAAVAENRVPQLFLRAYPSLKSLSAWTSDLVTRIRQLSDWSQLESTQYPATIWLAGFTYPSCFLTSVLQMTARKNFVPIDELSFSFEVMNACEASIEEPPTEGVYVRGLFLEGAGWNAKEKCLCEPTPLTELVVEMPVIHFKPTHLKKSSKTGTYYQCPLYVYGKRTGTRERPSFVCYVELHAGGAAPEHWIKRGTALLLSLAN